jgi:hypothetical protein
MRWTIDDHDYRIESVDYVYVIPDQYGEFTSQSKAVAAARRSRKYVGAGIEVKRLSGSEFRVVRWPAQSY